MTFFVHFFGALDFVAYFITFFGSEEKSCTIADAYCNAEKNSWRASETDLKLKAASWKRRLTLEKHAEVTAGAIPGLLEVPPDFFWGSFVVQETSCAWVLCLGGRDHGDTPYALRGSPASPNQHCWCFIQTFQVCTIHICNKFIYGNTSFHQNSPIFFCKTDFSQTFVSLDFNYSDCCDSLKNPEKKTSNFISEKTMQIGSSGRNWKIHNHHLLGTTGFGMSTKPKPESWPSWRGFSMSSIRPGTTGSSCEKLIKIWSLSFFSMSELGSFFAANPGWWTICWWNKHPVDHLGCCQNSVSS